MCFHAEAVSVGRAIFNSCRGLLPGFERKEQTSTVSPGNTLKLEKDDPRFVWPIPQHELDAPGVDLMPNESNK